MPEESTPNRLAEILRAIADADPPPWRPGEHAQRTGANRDGLDDPLNLLRVAGFIRLTDWEQGKGQGYIITPEGRRALANPKRLEPRRIATSPPPSSTSESKPVNDNAVTRLLIAAQAAVFALGFFQILEQGKPVGLYVYNGVAPVQGELLVARSFVEAGDWWRLWSYALVHGGLLHLALNLYGHWLDASLAERMWGRWRFTAMYLIAVLGGGVGAVLSSAHGTVGSSGGWCGVVAAQAVWIIMHRHRLLPAERRMWTQYYLRAAFLITAISLVPGVSWGGHLGGAVGGALAAMIAQMTLARPGVVRWIGAIVFVTLPIATVFGLLTLLRTW